MSLALLANSSWILTSLSSLSCFFEPSQKALRLCNITDDTAHTYVPTPHVQERLFQNMKRERLQMLLNVQSEITNVYVVDIL